MSLPHTDIHMSKSIGNRLFCVCVYFFDMRDIFGASPKCRLQFISCFDTLKFVKQAFERFQMHTNTYL